MKRTVTFALAAVFALALFELGITIACKSETPKASPAGEARAAAKATQAALQLSMTTEPSEPKYDKDFVMRVRVTDAAGKAVDDVQVHGSLNMKTMNMGKSEFDFVSKGDGNYEATAKPSMSGPWEIKLTAKRGADAAEKSFEMNVKE